MLGELQKIITPKEEKLMNMEQISREQLDKEQLGWLAGIIDGEGCISVGIYDRKCKSYPNHKRNKPYCRTLQTILTVSNHDVRVIKRVSEIYKKLGVGFYYSTAKKKDNGTWIININTTGKGTTRKALLAVRDQLVSKKEQMELLLQLIEYRKSLGYQGKGSLGICNDPKIQWYVNRIRELKHEFPSLPSETKRRANQILEF